ncbi:hypothetical protein CDEST_10383 [Colletotrichum destructivum]|uniref:Secreted protein n=1 Tax=Colletotrichum destructivum TaxID=34406 RepID=A0AAX4IPV8_9PEZI|nr:hypothetical protein CDEST_10383 [Colletotrichum destructivum]
MTRRAARWLASNGVCRGMMILMHHAFSLAGGGRFGWKAPTPSGTGGGNGRCRRLRSTTSQDIASWYPSTHSNGGFDMIRLRILRLRPALPLSRAQARRTTAEIPEYHYACWLSWAALASFFRVLRVTCEGDAKVPKRVLAQSLLEESKRPFRHSHQQENNAKNHFGRRSLDEMSGF